MSVADRHDARRFRHYARLNDDGSVAATIEVAEGAAQPETDTGQHVEITDIHPYDSQKIDAKIEASTNVEVAKRVAIRKAIKAEAAKRG